MTNTSDGAGERDAASELAIGLARQVMTTVAPEEGDIFDEVADTWRTSGDDVPAPGSSVGFGLDTALVSEIVLQVVTASIVEVMGLGVSAGVSRWRQWRQRRRHGTAPTDLTAKLPAVDGRIVMTPQQARQLRDVSRRHATALGLPAARADLLADAVVGAVHVLDPSQPGHAPH